MKKRAIISLSDKTGALEFAIEIEKLGYEIISTGGTAKMLREGGVKVIDASDVTNFQECLDGRVKTLHPNIHGGILAMRSNPEHMAQIEKMGIVPIDIVAINLYPFRQTVLRDGVTREEVIENIDIGGPSMLRAAAKNWQDVSVIVDKNDYAVVLDELKNAGKVSPETHLKLAYKVFEHTAQYDAMIADYLKKEAGIEKFPQNITLTFEKAQDMRYGENPHQAGAFYREITKTLSNGIAAAKQLHGKELSFNNINDANAAISIVKEFQEPTIVALKHTNPCGVCSADTIYDAYMGAYNSDPVSIFGGIVAANREIDAATATEMSKIFLEIIVAPSFTQEALDILTQKKNIRLLTLDTIAMPYEADMLDMKKVAGGILVQEHDGAIFNEADLKCVTEKAPTDAQMADMVFAYKIVKHVKSNAIVLVKDKTTVGVGPGQTNRIGALEIAAKMAGEKANGAILASDAFFPFSDCVECASAHGIAAIIQPGGSVRDEDSVVLANEKGIPMVFCGMRHFKH